MASIDSCFALSMKAHVFTTITSASAESGVISCPASRAMPSITSPSTRFLGQPRERRPIFMSGIDPVEHPRIGDRLAQVLEPTDPADDALDAHAEAAVRDAAVAPEIEVPLEGFLRQLVLVDPLQQQLVVVEALAAADDLPVAFGCEHVDAERDLGAIRIGLHVERLHRGRVAV